MKKLSTLAIALSCIMYSGLGMAQSATVQTSSKAQTASSAGATNAGNAQSLSLNSYAPDTQTLRSAPSVGGNSFYGSFSSDFCFGTEGGSISVIAAGGSIVKMTRDEVCTGNRIYERLQQGAAAIQSINPGTADKLRQASFDVMCMSSDIAMKAMSNQGLCSNLNPKKSAQVEPLQVADIKLEKMIYSSDKQAFIAAK